MGRSILKIIYPYIFSEIIFLGIFKLKFHCCCYTKIQKESVSYITLATLHQLTSATNHHQQFLGKSKLVSS